MRASYRSLPPFLGAALAAACVVTFGCQSDFVGGFSSSPIPCSPTRIHIGHGISPRYLDKPPSFNRISISASSQQGRIMTTRQASSTDDSSADESKQEQQPQQQEEEEGMITNKLDSFLSRMTSAFPPISSGMSSPRSSTNGSIQPQQQEEEDMITNKLDTVLSQLTSAFPLFVLGSAILGFVAPSTLQWVSRGNLISLMLASVMMGTGMTLEKKDFTQVLVDNFASVPAGVLCQFIIMPATALVVGRTLLLQKDPVLGPTLFLGLALVGCSPGGTASNLVSLIAKADVALSVLLTSCSTILASIATPLLVKLLVGSTVQVSGLALCSATAKVVLLPVILGMILNAKAPGFSKNASRFTPFASVLLVALICGGVVSNNASSLLGSSSTVSSASLLPWIVAAVLALHSIGFLAGYLVPRVGLGYSEKTARTISIETGMQNSALAVVLAQSIGANPLAALPGALSATAHSCLGSILAAYWRFVDSRRSNNESVNDGDRAKDGEKNESE